jgi:mycofactocin precursor
VTAVTLGGIVSEVAELEVEVVAEELVEEDLLVEDVSIDGMCGVY